MAAFLQESSVDEEIGIEKRLGKCYNTYITSVVKR